MMKKLQDFSFNKSQYERPTQKKICGWSIYGKPCQIGPNEKGECRVEFECVPYKRNDRWHCTRPASSGGKCNPGPSCTGSCSNRIPKCVPLSSTRHKRGKAVVWAGMMSVALILIFLFGPMQKQILSPGDLSSQHSFESQSCQDCHTSQLTNPSSIVKNAFATLSVSNESNKCQKCHQLGEFALNPHNLGLRQLDEISSRIKQTQNSNMHKITSLFSVAGFSKTNSGSDAMACVSCHSEHKGKDFDLKQMTNLQCANCHVNQFRGFDEDHPDFNQYPYKRRTGIIFDHNAHINDYFQKEKYTKNAPAGCNSCHYVSVTGRYMDTGGYEKNCIACHSKEVTGEKLEVRGLPVFYLPGIDIQTLLDKGYNVGQWPIELEDEELSSFMFYLLSSDSKVQPLLARLINGEIDLTDLSAVNKTTLKQISTLIWAIKSIIFDLSFDGHISLKNKLENLTQTKLAPDAIKSLIALLPEDVVSNAQKSWLPDLKKEITRFRVGGVVKTRIIKTKNIRGIINKDIDDWSSAGGWYRQQFSIFYRPQGHRDKFLYNWLELTKITLTQQKEVNVGKNLLFEQISNNKAPGQCTKCHSLEENNNLIYINWNAGFYNERLQKFSKFDHSAHFSMLAEEGCKTCHTLNENSDYLTSYKKTIATQFSGNFNSIKKAKCLTCHSQKKVSDSCLTCHNYHIGQRLTVVPTSLFK